MFFVKETTKMSTFYCVLSRGLKSSVETLGLASVNILKASQIPVGKQNPLAPSLIFHINFNLSLSRTNFHAKDPSCQHQESERHRDCHVISKSGFQTRLTSIIPIEYWHCKNTLSLISKPACRPLIKLMQDYIRLQKHQARIPSP